VLEKKHGKHGTLEKYHKLQPSIGVARAVKIFFRPNLQEKYVSAPQGHEVHPLAREKVNF